MNTEQIKAMLMVDKEVIYEDWFFDALKGTSLVKFRNNVNLVQSMVPTYYFENKVNKYYEELLSHYNAKNSIFTEY